MKLNSMYNINDAIKFYNNNRNLIDNTVKKIKDSQKDNNTNSNVISVIFSDKYSEMVIFDVIQTQSLFKKTDEELLKSVLNVLLHVFDDEVFYLETYKHTYRYIADESLLNEFTSPVMSLEEAEKIYENNKEAWKQDIENIYSSVSVTISEDDRDILVQEVKNAVLNSIIYGEKENNPLENIKSNLQNELKHFIIYKSLS